MNDETDTHVDPEPLAWLFICKRPGKVSVYASVDENDTDHWPLDQWQSVEKQPLGLIVSTPSRNKWTGFDIAKLVGVSAIFILGAANHFWHFLP